VLPNPVSPQSAGHRKETVTVDGEQIPLLILQ
jgi:hypothetical protein